MNRRLCKICKECKPTHPDPMLRSTRVEVCDSCALAIFDAWVDDLQDELKTLHRVRAEFQMKCHKRKGHGKGKGHRTGRGTPKRRGNGSAHGKAKPASD